MSEHQSKDSFRQWKLNTRKIMTWMTTWNACSHLSDVESARTKRQSGPAWSSCCGCTGPGDTTIVCPRIFAKTGWGMLGPHVFGPIFVMLLILWASHYFIKLSLKIGPVTTSLCVLATIWTLFTLCDVSFRDPGIVTDQTPPDSVDMSRWRWCDFCK